MVRDPPLPDGSLPGTQRKTDLINPIVHGLVQEIRDACLASRNILDVTARLHENTGR
jgi:hypothetical protein